MRDIETEGEREGDGGREREAREDEKKMKGERVVYAPP